MSCIVGFTSKVTCSLLRLWCLLPAAWSGFRDFDEPGAFVEAMNAPGNISAAMPFYLLGLLLPDMNSALSNTLALIFARF